LAKSAYGAWKLFLKWVPKTVTRLRPDQEEQVVIRACAQHGKHLATHGIQQTSLDAFKLVCWLGGSWLDMLDREKDVEECRQITQGLLSTLRLILARETEWNLAVPPSTMKLLASFIEQEWRGNTEHGIWMNGLYAAFHLGATSWFEGKELKKVVM
jgi:hypothetical protein